MHTLRLDFLASADFAEELSDTLLELGAQAVSFENDRHDELYEPNPHEMPLWQTLWVGAYFDDDVELAEVITIIEKHYYANQALDYKLTTLAEHDWNSKWQQYVKPMRFGKVNEFWVIPETFSSPLESQKLPDKISSIILTPGLAFGTGTHETTALCLDWLCDHLMANSSSTPHDQTLIDYGCGSGILGLAALSLGVKKVYGVDYDPQALIASRDNARLNQFSDQQLELYSPESFPLLTVDIIVANILVKALIELLPRFKALLKPHGKLVLSGILESQQNEIISAYQHDFVFNTIENRNGWILLAGTQK